MFRQLLGLLAVVAVAYTSLAVATTVANNTVASTAVCAVAAANTIPAPATA
jgi:hypothetical protein